MGGKGQFLGALVGQGSAAVEPVAGENSEKGKRERPRFMWNFTHHPRPLLY